MSTRITRLVRIGQNCFFLECFTCLELFNKNKVMVQVPKITRRYLPNWLLSSYYMNNSNPFEGYRNTSALCRFVPLESLSETSEYFCTTRFQPFDRQSLWSLYSTLLLITIWVFPSSVYSIHTAGWLWLDIQTYSIYSDCNTQGAARVCMPGDSWECARWMRFVGEIKCIKKKKKKKKKREGAVITSLH